MGRGEGEGFFFRGKLHLGQDETFVGSLKYIQFYGEMIGAFQRDQVARLGQDDAVRFFEQMGVSLFIEGKVIFGYSPARVELCLQ